MTELTTETITEFFEQAAKVNTDAWNSHATYFEALVKRNTECFKDLGESRVASFKEMSEATRLMVDVCGGYVADLPSDKDFENPEVGDLIKKYMKGANGVPVEKRIKMFRLAEKLAMESADTISDIHGGGSPEAHRVTILRETNIEQKKKAAQRLAGIEE